MAIPPPLRERLERWCVDQTPEEHRHQHRLEARFRGNTAVVVTLEPPWDGTDGPWMDLKVARLRFDPATERWDLAWFRGTTERWWPYEDWSPSPLAACLAEIEADPWCVFWG